jgi:hypothetical protein
MAVPRALMVPSSSSRQVGDAHFELGINLPFLEPEREKNRAAKSENSLLQYPAGLSTWELKAVG